MTRRAIIGSRGYSGPEPVEVVRLLPAGTIVVSGGASGVDLVAETEARRRDDLPPPEIVRADWDVYGKIAGKRRNWPLVHRSDEVDAFWDGWSNGTAHAVTVAVALQRPVRVTLDPRLRWRLEELIA